MLLCSLCFLFLLYGVHLDLHVLTHSFPTRRSPDLLIHGAIVFDDVAFLDLGRFHGGGDSGIGLLEGERLLGRSEEHTSELQSLMRISYAVFCLKTKNIRQDRPRNNLRTKEISKQ